MAHSLSFGLSTPIHSEIIYLPTCTCRFSTGSSDINNVCSPIITKLRSAFFYKSATNLDRWIIYSGGCSSLPDGVDSSCVLSIFFAQERKFNLVVPFDSRVVDFMCIEHCSGLIVVIVIMFV